MMKKIFISLFLAGIAMANHAMDNERQALEQQDKDHQEILTRYNAMLIACAVPSEKSIQELDEQFEQVRKHQNKFLAHILWEIKYRCELFTTARKASSECESELNFFKNNSAVLHHLEGKNNPAQKKKAQEVWATAQQEARDRNATTLTLFDHLHIITHEQLREAQVVQTPEQYSNLKQKCSEMRAVASAQDDNQLTSLFKEVKEHPNQLFALLAWQQINSDKKATERALDTVEYFTSEIKWRRETITNFEYSHPLYAQKDRAQRIHSTLKDIDKLYGQ